ncbi:unnamed protein product [Symbiodinium sp. CCMP2456]|nr:unnamed protein product [Symbiodinium sp. CCMP2456]
MGEVGRPGLTSAMMQARPAEPAAPALRDPTYLMPDDEVQPDEEALDAAYRVWSQGGYSDSEIRSRYGDEIMTGFLAQWLSAHDDLPGDATEAEGMQDTQLQDEGSEAPDTPEG